MTHRKPQPHAERTAPGGAPSGGVGAADTVRVLVVDDDQGTRLLMQETLLAAGFEVAEAGTGSEAVSVCDAFAPDLVLLDINMPDMDGIQACAEIRRRSVRHFPIVMVTSVDDAMSIQGAFEAGATDFIVKPVNWPLFQKRMQSIMADWQRSQDVDENEMRLSLLRRVAPEQVMLVSRNGVVIEDLKERPDEIGGKGGAAHYPTLDELYGPDVARRFRQCISGVLKTGKSRRLTFEASNWGMTRECEAEFLVDGRERVIVVVQSASEAAAPPKELYQLAFHDFVTGLPNRHLFTRTAAKALTKASLQDRSIAVVSLCFRNLTAELLADDGLITAVASTLRQRSSDAADLMTEGLQQEGVGVSRIDANHFVFLLDKVSDGAAIRDFCQQIGDRLAEPVSHGDAALRLEPVIGVAIFPTDAADAESLLHAARGAMEEARRSGRLCRFHTSESSVPAVETLDYGAELRRAIDKGELELHFQPRIALDTGAVTCVEALLRWNHPMRGYVGLDEMLQLAKVTGMIVPLGDWVLKTACGEAARWRGRPAPRVSVNLSHQEFLREDLVRRLDAAMLASGLPPHRLELELTESALLRASDCMPVLAEVKALGVALVLDDFGTGHTSLASLCRYPIDALKIDASFVHGMTENGADQAICEIVIMMAHRMGLKAIAEGVETAGQLAMLEDGGCDEAQGYRICRPLPADEVAAYIAAGAGASA